jgi:hypothetical protein
MRTCTNSVGAFAIASLLCVAVASSARAQIELPAPPVAPTTPAALGAPVPVLPQEGRGVGPLPEAVIPAQTQALPPLTIVPGQTPAQPPLMSSQPPPFQVAPGTPAATNDPNFFSGFPHVQDPFAHLLAGKFRDTKYKWYGFVRMDGIYDFRPIASTDMFVTSAIPVPQGRGQNFVMTPRYTRLGWDTETPIESMDWTIKTRIELDFFNGNRSGSFGSFPPRLRFAWADVGPFLIGQAASLFMDYDVFPNVLDYEGPGGMILMRQPVAAVRVPLGEKFKLTVGIEQPYSDIQWLENGVWVTNPQTGIITTPGVARNVQDVPDVTANLRYVDDYGHVQVAGIARKLTYQPADGDSALDTMGYGINVTGTLHPWAMMTGTPKTGDCATVWSKSRFLAQFAAGRGINRYMQDINGLGLDASFDPVSGFRAIPSYGWFVAYEQWWGKKLASNFTYGEDSNDLTDSMPGNTYQSANYVSANLIWLPVERMGLGLEYLYGFRKNKDGQKGDDTRIQMAFQYKF